MERPLLFTCALLREQLSPCQTTENYALKLQEQEKIRSVQKQSGVDRAA